MPQETCDVIVLGAGAGGMAAAAVAAASGQDVLLVERTSLVGGTTAISGGMVWVPANRKMADAGLRDSLEAARLYLDRTVPGSAATREAFLRHADEAIAFLERHTALRLRPVCNYPDYYPLLPGATLGGRVLEPMPFDARALGRDFALLRPPLPEFMLLGGMMVARPDIPHFRNATRSWRSARRAAGLIAAYAWQRLSHPRGTTLVLGNALAGQLLLSIRQLGARLLLGTYAERLLMEAGTVGGAILAQGSSRRWLVRARRGVVIATGGFSHDAELRAGLLPRTAGLLSVAGPANDGGGIRLARAAGAGLHEGGAGNAFWVPVSRFRRRDGSEGIFPHTVTDRSKPGVIAVNRAGRRFTNEARSYHDFVQAMLREDDAGPIAVPAWLVCDRDFIRQYGLGAVRPLAASIAFHRRTGYLAEAPTLRALASRIGVDADGLETTVARHNADARDGVDREFGRGSDAYQRHLGDAACVPNPCMRPIERVPFYAMALYPGDLGTAAGLATDAHGRVLDASGDPIPRLYACGNDMASVMGGAYPGPGITLGPALAFAYLSIRHMLGDT
jgi:succinate dehydrogenase/fumarate reductase flavoprotein subunit